MDDFSKMIEALPLGKPDLDKQFLDGINALPLNRRPRSYNLTPHVIIPDYLIKNLEDKLKTFYDDKEKMEQKNKAFEKFYNDELKSTFEDILKIRAPMMEQTYPNGVFKVSEKQNTLGGNNIAKQLKLPVFQYSEEILQAVENHTFVLIKGETGSGKTTQIPQMILNSNIERGLYCHIICTQPRRITAVSIAERVAYERNEKLGESVGYQIRLEQVLPRPVDSILYCTTGVLLRMMISDPILTNVSHVILDEIHERNIDSDLLIGLIQLVVKYNKQIKVLVMSATFGFEEYAKHFSNYKIINIEGTLHPVQKYYLEDILENIEFYDFRSAESYLQKKHQNFYNSPEGIQERIKLREFTEMISKYTNEIQYKYSPKVINALRNPFSEDINLDLILKLIEYIDTKLKEGAILIFLPGYDKILALYELLQELVDIKGKKYVIYPAHSIMPVEEQKGIFDKSPTGIRKIILSTNIAETSITIDDIVYVINPGKVKIKNYDIKNKIETIEEYWITQANAIQRQGRAGRCQKGICFNLYTRAREHTFEQYPVPEIQRARMESVIMHLKSLKVHDVKSFLNSLISAPHQETIQNGINFLQQMNALDENEVMTPLGLHIAQLPIDPQIGKMLLMATIFDCLDPITTVVATLTLKDPFCRILKLEDAINNVKLIFSQDSKSDHIAYINVLNDYRKAVADNRVEAFCKTKFISNSCILDIERLKIQLCELLESIGFIKHTRPDNSEINKCSTDTSIIRAVITAGLYPNIAVIRSANSMRNNRQGNRVEHLIQTPEDGLKVRINFTSVNRKQIYFASNYLAYFNKHKSGDQIYLRENTMTSPLAIIMFTHDFKIKSDTSGKYYISVGDNKYCFPSNFQTCKLLWTLRRRFDKILENLVLNPMSISDIEETDKNVIEALKTILKYNL